MVHWLPCQGLERRPGWRCRDAAGPGAPWHFDLQGVWRGTSAVLQHIEGAHCQLVSVEGLRALCALRAGCLDLQHIAGANCHLVSIEGLRTWCALRAGCPGLQHIEGANCQLVSIEGLRALCALSSGCPGLQHIEGACPAWKCQWSCLPGLKCRKSCMPGLECQGNCLPGLESDRGGHPKGRWFCPGLLST